MFPAGGPDEVEGARERVELGAVLLAEEDTPGLAAFVDLVALVPGRDSRCPVRVERAVEIEQEEWAHHSTLGFVGAGS